MPEDEDEDLILERLREATAGESTARQLRRRYDLLRRDYEVLIDRLAELEERIGETPSPSTAAPEAVAPQGAGRGLAAEIMERMLQPLLALQAEYAEALTAMQGLVGGLETVMHGAMKGQRGGSRPGAATEPAPTASAPGEPEPAEANRIYIDVRAPGFGDLLDFQEKLAALAGVTRVSISAIDSERATFVVELDG